MIKLKEQKPDPVVKIIKEAKLDDKTKRTKASYPSPADFESVGSKLSDVIESAESGDIGKA